MVETFFEGEIDDALLIDLLLIASELVANAVKHGNQADPVWLHLLRTEGEIAITVTGAGPAFDPVNVPSFSPGPAAESGRGLLIVRELADEFSLFSGGVTIVRTVHHV
jgi:anti-sigma regulatory factor (Ser/Thr protein kinase)